MKRIVLVLSLLLAGICSVEAHPIKMTTSKLTLDRKTGQLTLVMNFFIDDFEAHLQKIYHQRNLRLASGGDQEKSMINAYVAKKLLIKANRQALLLKLSSVKKLEDNVLQVAFNIPIASVNFKQLEITNVLLFDAFPQEQVNIVHLDLQTKVESPVLQFSPSDSYKAVSL